MSVAMKPFSILFGMALVVVTGAAMAADAVAVRAAPVPVFAYPPLYPYPVYTLPYYGQLAQNPYLPPRPAAPQALPPNTLYPWPFFMLVPQPSTPAAVAPSPAPVASAQAAPQLTQEAQKALAQAEADVLAARAAFTLWVPAENAFNTAQEAAKAGDSAAVLKQAKAIAELTRLGAAQANYASTEALEASVAMPAAPVVTPTPVVADVMVATTPELTGEARVALAQAEIDVQTARDNFSLWVPAENAFNAAQEAAKAGDSAAVLKQAKTVTALIKLGAEQANYPSTEAIAAPAVIAVVQEAVLPPPLPAVAAAVAVPQLTDEARKALAQAEADVQAARAAFTLWVPAESAFNIAQEAAKAGDSATVLKQAKLIAELTRLGTAQAKYPSTEVAAKPAAKRKAKPKSTIKKVTSKPSATPPTSKPKAASSSVKATPPTTAKPAASDSVSAKPAAVSAKPATTDNKIKPRKLCWQGDRLEECP